VLGWKNPSSTLLAPPSVCVCVSVTFARESAEAGGTGCCSTLGRLYRPCGGVLSWNNPLKLWKPSVEARPDALSPSWLSSASLQTPEEENPRVCAAKLAGELSRWVGMRDQGGNDWEGR